MKLFELNEKQQKAFNRLKKAHKDCINANIEFYNNYGTLGALDGLKFVNKAFGVYNDENIEGSIEDISQNSGNEFRLKCGEWSDDTHYFHPNLELIDSYNKSIEGFEDYLPDDF